MKFKITLKFIFTTLGFLSCLFYTYFIEFPFRPLPSYAAPAIVWDYQGAVNPQNWGQIAPICATGQNQSPINIITTKAQDQDLDNIVFHYQSFPLHILNNGRTVQVNSDRYSYITIDHQKYTLKQFHYHSPSEHSINGQTFPAELHLVHQFQDKYAVVSIFLTSGISENIAYKPLIDHLPLQESPENSLELTINPARLLPTNQTTYRYSGSLTTPPCTEAVTWLIMTTPVKLSSLQIETLQQAFNGNNRPLQVLGDRSITQDNTT